MSTMANNAVNAGGGDVVSHVIGILRNCRAVVVERRVSAAEPKRAEGLGHSGTVIPLTPSLSSY